MGVDDQGSVAPASVQRLFEALRADAAGGLSAEHKAEMMGSFWGNLQGWMARAREESAGGERSSDVYPVSGGAGGAGASAGVSAGDTGVSFEGWAGVSARLLGVSAEEKAEVLSALGVSREVWNRVDEGYRRMLSDDLRAGRTDRAALYRARCEEEARRRGVLGSSSPSASSAVGEGVSEGVSGRGAGGLRGTAQALDLPAEARAGLGLWPFQAAPSSPSVSAGAAFGGGKGQQQPKTLMTQRAASLGGTMPLGGDAIQKAVASVPFAGAGAGAGAHGVVSIPNLKVKEYVSLRAALAALPERAEETLRRFGVANEAVRRALDEHWRGLLAARADLRAERDAAVEEYARWLRGEG